MNMKIKAEKCRIGLKLIFPGVLVTRYDFSDALASNLHRFRCPNVATIEFCMYGNLKSTNLL